MSIELFALMLKKRPTESNALIITYLNGTFFINIEILETVNNVNGKVRLNIFDSLMLHFLLVPVLCSNNFRRSCKALGWSFVVGFQEWKGDGAIPSTQRLVTP